MVYIGEFLFLLRIEIRVVQNSLKKYSFHYRETTTLAARNGGFIFLYYEYKTSNYYLKICSFLRFQPRKTYCVMAMS